MLGLKNRIFKLLAPCLGSNFQFMRLWPAFWRIGAQFSRPKRVGFRMFSLISFENVDLQNSCAHAVFRKGCLQKFMKKIKKKINIKEILILNRKQCEGKRYSIFPFPIAMACVQVSMEVNTLLCSSLLRLQPPQTSPQTSH